MLVIGSQLKRNERIPNKVIDISDLKTQNSNQRRSMKMKNLNSAKEKKKPKSQNRRLGNLNDDDCHTHVQGPRIPTCMVLDYVSHHWLSNLIR